MRVENRQLQEFLIDADFLDKQVIQENYKEAVATGKQLGEVLIEKKLVSEVDMRKLYSYILGIPFVNLEKTTIEPEVLQIIPEPIAKKYNIIAFDKRRKELKIAMVNPEDLQTIDFIRKKSGLKIIPCLATQKSIQEVLKQYEKSLKAEFGDIIDKDTDDILVESDGDEDVDEEKLAHDIPVVRIVDTLLKHAILQQASDIHIEPAEKEVIVRYRIDGILHDAMLLPRKVLSALVARIKVLTNLKLDEHRLPQDGRFKVEKDGYKISFRVSLLPIFDGEKIVMRLLDESSKGLTLEKIGFSGRDLELMHRQVKKPNGMILVTGPTGSGKTTTLYTVVDILNTPEVNISTVEDPVEYRMQRINQTQVHSKIGMTFAAALRALLRQDPDIIMVGEIRDKETMEIAMHAAMTGHLVLSTLHTNSAAATIPRLLDMGAEPFLVASTLNVVLAQRLARRLCPDCRQSYKMTEDELKTLKDNFNVDRVFALIKNRAELPQKPKAWTDLTFYRKGSGCQTCGEEGYKGRAGVFELLEVTEAIQELVIKESSSDVIERQARDEGMTTMIEDGMLKAARGLTSIEEVLRVTQE